MASRRASWTVARTPDAPWLPIEVSAMTRVNDRGYGATA